MIRYLFKRFLSGLILLFIYVSVLFFAVQLILPGDYVSQFVLSMSSQESQQLRQQLGLDLPIWQRYFIWLSNLLRGDLGTSYSSWGQGPPVSEVIAQTLPVTLLIFGVGTILAFVIGRWLGKVAAWRGPGLVSGSITFTSIALYTSFPPWLAFLMIYFVVWRFNIPISMQGRPSFDAPKNSQAVIMTKMLLGLGIAFLLIFALNWLYRRWRRRPLKDIAVFLMILLFWGVSWFGFGIWQQIPGILRQISLPILTFVLLSFGEVMLIMRTSMMDTLHEDYVQTARAKGLSSQKVRDEHAARTALMPVTSRLMISLPFLLSGMVMIEEVMNIQGIGTTLFYAVGMQNVPLALGTTIIIGVVSLLARLILEVMQAGLDPRIRITSKP
jgi:peptide/nickel transport system permease protein